MCIRLNFTINTLIKEKILKICLYGLIDLVVILSGARYQLFIAPIIGNLSKSGVRNVGIRLAGVFKAV